MKNPHCLAVSTEYGFRGSNSKRGHGNLGQQQILTILRAYDHNAKIPTSVKVVENENGDSLSQKQKTVPEQISEMKKLLDDGVITEEEFSQFKKKVLEL